MKAIYIFFSLVFINLSCLIAYQPPDSCLKIYFEDYSFDPFSSWHNLDSVKIDSCEYSSTYLLYYSYNKYSIHLAHNVLPRHTIHDRDDTLLYNWQDIDASFSSAKSEFQSLESLFGQYKLKDAFPDMPDTNVTVRYSDGSTIIHRRHFEIIFDDYVCKDSVLATLNSFNIIYEAGFYPVMGVLSNIEDTRLDSEFDIFPNPVQSTLTIKNDFDIPHRAEIYSLDGLKLLDFMITSREYRVDVGNLKEGMYLLKIKDKFNKFIVIW